MGNQHFEQMLVDPDHLLRVQAIAKKQTQGTSISWEDASQVATIKLLQAVKQGKFRADLGKFYHWAASVARNEIIDFVRKELRRPYTSLDQTISGTDLTLLDTLSSQENLLDALERKDLVARSRDALKTIDQRYSHKQYRALFEAQTEGLTQTQIAASLGITQSAVSKRMKELTLLLNEALNLGLLSVEAVKRDRQSNTTTTQQRSDCQW
jgi:RNA polymerase sigma factor (sigma-70 family)